MEGERKIISEGLPLNSSGATNIVFNTGKIKAKVNSPDNTIIRLNTEKSDLGVHINTTFSIASSKKLKILFVFNFMLSALCMAISCSIAFYYWNEMISMRKQLEAIRNQSMPNWDQDNIVSSALVGHMPSRSEARRPRLDDIALNAKRYYVEDLGEDMLLVDSNKKKPDHDKHIPNHDFSIFQKELLVVQFYGAVETLDIGKNPIIGPWVLDTEISSKNSLEKIELHNNFVTIKESGLYLVYAQIMYVTSAPNCYYIWARQTSQEPRLLTSCGTGERMSKQSLDRSQISCSVQTLARLYKGDTVNIAQREPNQILKLERGYSYFGFVKLSS